MKLSIKAGATSESINVFVADSSSTTGAGLTGLVFNTSGLTAYYSFSGANATATAITLATLAAVNSAYSSGGFKEIDATNMPGWYRFDLPNACLATSKGRSVAIHLKGAANMAPLPVEVELTGWDNQDAVRGGMTALPNVASGSAGALLVDGTGTAAISNSAGKVLLQATQSGVTIPTVTTVTNQLTAAQIATGVWTDTTAGDFTTALSVGKSIMNGVTLGTGLTVASVSGAVGSVTGAVGSVTGAVGSVTGAVGSVTAGVTVTTNNDKTGYSLTVSPPTAAAVATAVWQDTTAGDFTVASSIGKSLYTTGATPGAAGGLFIAGTNAATTITTALTTTFTGNLTGSVGSVTGAVGSVTGAVGSVTAGVTVTTNNDKTGYSLSVSPPTAAAVATAVWQDTTAGDFTVASSIGKSLYTTGNAPGAASGLALVGSNMGSVTSVSGAVGSVTGAVGSVTGGVTVTTNNDKTGYSLTATTGLGNQTSNITGSLSGSVGSVTGAVGSVTGAVGSVTGAVGSVTGAVGSVTAGVTVTTNNDKTGYSLTVSPPTAAAVATAVWQDATAGDFTTANSVGKSLYNAFTAGTSVFTTAALANAPGGGSGVTVNGYASGQDPATLVLGATAASWNTSGTIGQKINSAGGAADPLLNTVPGSYASGTAGYALGGITGIKSKTDLITAGNVTVTSPLSTTGATLTLFSGDDYASAESRTISFTDSVGAWPDLTSASSAAIVFNGSTSIAAVITTPTGTKLVTVTLTAAQTAALPLSGGYKLKATFSNGHVVTLSQGAYTAR